MKFSKPCSVALAVALAPNAASGVAADEATRRIDALATGGRYFTDVWATG